MTEQETTAAAGDELAAVSLVTRVRLTARMTRALRLALLEFSSPIELELVEERYGNGDVAVRLARPDRPEDGERVLGVYRTEARPAGTLFDGA